MVNPPGGGIFRRAPPEVFVRPKRQIMQTQGSGQFGGEVTTYDDLVAMLGKVAAQPRFDVAGTSAEMETPNRCIVIAAPIQMENLILLTEDHSGLVITATGRGGLKGVDGLDVFQFDGCSGVVIENLSVQQQSGYLVRVLSTTRGAVLRDINTLTSQMVITEAGANLDAAHIERIRAIGLVAPAARGIDISGSDSLITGCTGFAIRLRDDGDSCRIMGNVCSEPLGATPSIEVAAGHGYDAIVGNRCTDITTSASDGFNTIVGNVTAGGTITSAGTDAVAGNT